jgi:hypothetical protein
MKWALIGVAAIALVGSGINGPARAVLLAPPRDAIAAAQSPPSLPVRYYRHRWYYRHYGYWRRGHSRWARYGEPKHAAGGSVKPGRWEFIARLQAPAASQLPAETQLLQGTEPQSGGGIKTSYLYCVTSDRAVPAEFGPQCKLDSTDRNGATITWAMTCTNTQGKVRSDGVAQYSGDTMEGTMISHLPGTDGKPTDTTQHITGRYLGPCAQQPE